MKHGLEPFLVIAMLAISFVLRETVEFLVSAAEKGGIVMMAEIAMCQALARGRASPPEQPRKKPAKVYKVTR
jgi:hypothetical protein